MEIISVFSEKKIFDAFGEICVRRDVEIVDGSFFVDGGGEFGINGVVRKSGWGKFEATHLASLVFEVL